MERERSSRWGWLPWRRHASTGAAPAPEDHPCVDAGLARTVDARKRYAGSKWTGRDWRDYILFGRKPEPIPSYTGVVEPPEEGKIGIACSGGGIRSAAFSLGALQVLTRHRVLQQSRYLAAVSGGSYIASAFCMVRKTWEGSERPPTGEAGHDDSDPSVVTDERPPFFAGSPEEQYLRNRSSYLAPGLDGKLQLVLRLLLGLGINLGFLALFLIALGTGLALAYGAIFPELARHVGSDRMCSGQLCHFTPLAISHGIWIPVLSVAGLGILFGGGSIVAYRWRSSLRDFAETWSLRLLVLAVALATLLIGIPLLVSLFRAWGTVKSSAVAVKPSVHPVNTALQVVGLGAGGTATVGGAILLQLRAEWINLKKTEQKLAADVKWYRGLPQRLRLALAYLAAAVLGPLLALATMLVATNATLNVGHPYVRWIVFGATAGTFVLIYSVADLTTWSLHPFYRRRLASAFALKRVRRPEGIPPIAREEAGIAEERDYHELVRLSETAIPHSEHGQQVWPTLIVCAAANISDGAATPPGRAVTSFTFSANAMGGPLIGAVQTRELENACDARRGLYFTLPAAVAVSGAAISPSMGKLTRRPLRFLMALGNVRLGVWVPNPRRIDTFKARNRVYPRPRPSYLACELLGINRLDAPYLYITDGGHYENLGLVELLRRGCTEIYCFDASDDKFDALGDAVSLARSELEVEVEISSSEMQPDTDGIAKENCVMATVHFPQPDAPPAHIYYSRAVMTADLPADVVSYHARDPRFPHDPTSDQLYPDQRFEAYRALGACAAKHALRRAGRVAAAGAPELNGDHTAGQELKGALTG
jgi:hypothetical protein